MRFFAFLAALAGLVAVGSQGAILGMGVAGMAADQQDLIVMIQNAGRWAQLAFVTLMTLFLFLFALSKRSAAS